MDNQKLSARLSALATEAEFCADYYIDYGSILCDRHWCAVAGDCVQAVE